MPATPDTAAPRKTAFFDFDGTLAAPVFETGGKKTPGFPFENWKEYLSKNPDAYMSSAPVLPVMAYAIRLRACGWDLKVLTGTNRDGSEQAKQKWLDETGFAWLFSGVIPVDGQPEKVRRVLEYAAGHGLAPSDCLVVDDNYVTVVTAEAAGIPAVHVSHVIARNYDPSGTDPALSPHDA